MSAIGVGLDPLLLALLALVGLVLGGLLFGLVLRRLLLGVGFLLGLLGLAGDLGDDGLQVLVIVPAVDALFVFLDLQLTQLGPDDVGLEAGLLREVGDGVLCHDLLS